jgi:hypothetical protein
MAKKSKTSEPAPSPPLHPAPLSISISDAIRAALDDLGVEANKNDVEGWIKAKHPSLKYKESTLNTTLSNIRKKLRGDGNGSSGPQPTLNDLLKVKKLAEEQGGVDDLIARIEKMETVAAQVGGVNRLRQCLAALKKIKA